MGNKHKATMHKNKLLSDYIYSFATFCWVLNTALSKLEKKKKKKKKIAT